MNRPIVGDTHVDTIQWALLDGADLGKRYARAHCDLPRLERAGVNAPFFSLWVDPIFTGTAAVKRTLRMIDAVRQLEARYPDRIAVAGTVREVRRITRSGRIAALMGIEGGHAIDDSLEVLREFHRAGVRYLTLTHTNTNNWADSCADEPRNGTRRPPTL